MDAADTITNLVICCGMNGPLHHLLCNDLPNLAAFTSHASTYDLQIVDIDKN